jgi:hypothetical protein
MLSSVSHMIIANSVLLLCRVWLVCVHNRATSGEHSRILTPAERVHVLRHVRIGDDRLLPNSTYARVSTL